MAPLILVQDMGTLTAAYVQATQSSIFNKSPFWSNTKRQRVR
jgi:hypothetical protein